MLWTNFHSHCHYCDGTDRPENYLQEAVRQRVKVYGFSSHAPLPFAPAWAMKYSNVARYLEEIQHLKHKFEDLLEVYTGLEIDYIPNLSSPNSDYIKTLHLDYAIGSVHYVDRFPDGTPWEIDGTTKLFKAGLKAIFKDNIKKAIKRYYELIREMVENHTPDIIGHLDKIKIHNLKKDFFLEDEKWYRREVEKTLLSIAKSGSILEVNVRGLYKNKPLETYPSLWILAQARELNIPIMINSDCHHPLEITRLFVETAEALLRIGYTEVRILHKCTWQNRPLSPEGIQVV